MNCSKCGRSGHSASNCPYSISIDDISTGISRLSFERKAQSSSSSTSSKSSSLVCSICLDELNEKPKRAITTCGHGFCIGCLLEWRQSSPTCPMCRTKLGPQDVVEVGTVIARERTTSSRQKKLLIFAMRGTLIDRQRHLNSPCQSVLIGNYRIVKRPFLDELLEFAFKNFKVAIWSSAEPQNTSQSLIEYICGDNRPSFVWSREETVPDIFTRRNADTRDDRYATVKDLKKVWSNFPDLGYSFNTILIDDTISKARRQPDNHIFIKPWDHSNMEDEVLLELKDFLSEILNVDDVRGLLPHHVGV